MLHTYLHALCVCACVCVCMQVCVCVCVCVCVLVLVHLDNISSQHNGRVAQRHTLQECLHGTRVAVCLDDVGSAANEGTQLIRQALCVLGGGREERREEKTRKERGKGAEQQLRLQEAYRRGDAS